MPYVKFAYNLDEDKKNILRVINNPSTFGLTLKRQYGKLSMELVEKLKSEKDQVAQNRIVADFLEENLANRKEYINQKIEKFQKDWDKINDEYFKRLEKIFNIKISPAAVYTAYLTSAGGCPFDARLGTFMVRLDDEATDTVAAHEIMHIEFRRNLGSYCRDVLKLSPKDFGAFQEASTFLLNDEMGDLLSRPDYGYEEHQELRSKLSVEWTKNKNINNLLDYYKKLVDHTAL